MRQDATATSDDWAEKEALRIATDSGLGYYGPLIDAIASALRAARARGVEEAAQLIDPGLLLLSLLHVLRSLRRAKRRAEKEDER